MKNKFFITLFLIGCSLFATAQNYSLRIHHFGDVTNQWNTSSISSITLNQGVATFSVNGSDMAKAFSEIDSITFYRNGTTPTTYYTVTVTANPNNGGTVSGGGTYNYGQACTVIATSADGFTFLNWTENGSVVSNDANYSFTVTGNRSLVANFNEQLPDTYNINVSPNPIIGGIVTGGGTYDADQQCTVTATPNPNYNFINWTEDGEEVSTEASYTFIVAGNRNLVANFQYVVGIEENGSSCHIYPNPMASVVNITTERAAQSISIYDLYGHLLMKHSVNGEQLEIDLSDLSPGAYLLQIDYGDSTTVHRVIKAE